MSKETAMNVSEWSIADWLLNVPTSLLWSALVAIVAVFWVGHRFAKWTETRKSDRLSEELERARNRPDIAIRIEAEERNVSDIAPFFSYSFTRERFIRPEILRELEGWISDGLPVFAAVDLEGAMVSNRFGAASEILDGPNGTPTVAVPEAQHPSDVQFPFYRYRYIGASPGGTHILLTESSGGGSGVFCHLLFLRFQHDTVMAHEKGQLATRDRVLLKCIGSYGLGDRYDGELSFAEGVLSIGPRVNYLPDQQPDPIKILVE